MRMAVVRVSENTDTTFGAFIREDGTAFAVSIELKWAGNQNNISRIPAGTYICKRTWSNRFKIETFEITGVPGRSRCLVHPANLSSELEGCIAIGHGFDFVTTKKAADDGVVGSRKEFEEFMKLQDGVDEFEFTVLDPPVGAV